MMITFLLALSAAPLSHAIVVGENRGSDGQGRLRYAEDDARLAADTLREVAHFSTSDVHLLEGASRAQILAEIANTNRAVAAERASGAQVTLLFYYSGHAHASALSIGGEELGLAELREALLRSGASLTLVLLDACQSGAFSRVKGAGSESDFSYNSMQRLNAEGFAVMASSSASELSQESEMLRGSFFTHHLLTALRGAADSDQDGRVSLSEAYTYAYNQTLFDTSRTAIGEQHVTLETELRGKGDVPLSYPAETSAHLALPAALNGTLLIARQPQRTVVAELYKAAGQAMELALQPGDYLITVREDGHVSTCALALDGTTALDTAKCVTIANEDTRAKRDTPQHRWGLELGFGAATTNQDRYRTRLADFGFVNQSSHVVASGDSTHTNLIYQATVTYAFLPELAALLSTRYLDQAFYARDLHDSQGNLYEDTFAWATYALDAGVRGLWPLAKGHVVPFAQVGLGIAIARSSIVVVGQAHTQYYVGPLIDGGLGVLFRLTSHFGLQLIGNYGFAPALRNLIGDTHDSGGLALSGGVEVRL